MEEKRRGLSVHRGMVRDIMVEPIGTEHPQKGQWDLSIDGGQQRESEGTCCEQEGWGLAQGRRVSTKKMVKGAEEI